MELRHKQGLIVGIISVIFVLIFGLFTVQETQRAIIIRLGRAVEDSAKQPVVYVPGLHFKIPFIDVVRYFDTRIQTIEIQSSRIVTSEKKDVMVDLFVKWRVRDFITYFTRTGGDRFKAEKLLREKIVDGVRAEFGLRTIQLVVSGERDELMRGMLRDANRSAENLGIEVVDTRVKRIDLPTEVSEAVYERMRTERERIASEHRARGQAKAEMIRAKADANATIAVAQAERTAKKLRGEGDAESARLYVQGPGQDPEFYNFLRSLEAMRMTFKDQNDILILKPDSQFFRYFQSAGSKE